MVLVGVALILGSLAAGLGPIALISGVLMFWSGIVKVIVLRIWHAILVPHPAPDDPRCDASAKSTIGSLP